MQRPVEASLKRHLVARQHAHFLATIVVEGMIRLGLAVEEQCLDGHEAAEPPCSGDNTVDQEKLEFAHWRQLNSQPFPERHEVWFALAFDKTLSA